jgi:hypothetical protein
MDASQPNPPGDGELGQVLLGSAYLLVGVGLVVSLVVDSTALFLAVLAAIVTLTALSLVVLFRREGVNTPENRLVGACVLVAMGLGFAVVQFTNLPEIIGFGVVVVVGIVVPTLLRNRTDYGSAG